MVHMLLHGPRTPSAPRWVRGDEPAPLQGETSAEQGPGLDRGRPSFNVRGPQERARLCGPQGLCLTLTTAVTVWTDPQTMHKGMAGPGKELAPSTRPTPASPSQDEPGSARRLGLHYGPGPPATSSVV